jgi:hypothetical protein
MRRTWSVSRFRSFLAMLAAVLLATAAARPGYAADRTFTCPRDGMWIERMWVDTQYVHDIWFDGADPKDAAMCYVRYMPLGPHGERFHLSVLYDLFTYRSPFASSYRLLYNDDFRRAMNALLTGQTDKAHFILAASINGNAPTHYSEQTWQRLPNETLTIGDRVVDAMVFRSWSERKYVTGLPTGGHVVTKRWFDPKTSIFVKKVVEESALSGVALDYVVLQIHDAGTEVSTAPRNDVLCRACVMPAATDRPGNAAAPR